MTQGRMFEELWRDARRVRYKDVLTAVVTTKGMLDVDTVKGCSAGMRAYPNGGCYGVCYAAKIARSHGVDFATSVTRTAKADSERRAVERAVKKAPQGVFRVGTMGDPCHDWEATVETVEWLSRYARPVIVTKHWTAMDDRQIRRLVAVEAVLNTSVSALDTSAELGYRLLQRARYLDAGGHSVLRIVSCKYVETNEHGRTLAGIQRGLFALAPVIDNPIRLTWRDRLTGSGLICVDERQDLTAVRVVSVANDAYLGHCRQCTDLCGVALAKGVRNGT